MFWIVWTWGFTRYRLKYTILIKKSEEIATEWSFFVEFWAREPNLHSNIVLRVESKSQNLDQTLCSKSEQKLALLPNIIPQICTKLSSTRFSASISAPVTTSTSVKNHFYHSRTTLKGGFWEWNLRLILHFIVNGFHCVASHQQDCLRSTAIGPRDLSFSRYL